MLELAQAEHRGTFAVSRRKINPVRQIACHASADCDLAFLAGRDLMAVAESVPEICRTALPESRSMERYGGGAIIVADYDSAWPRMFEQERAKLEEVLGALVVGIEHVGSTAVPGLAAKPIIDLALGVNDLNEAEGRCIAALPALGYSYMPEYRSWLPDELFFRKGAAGPWTHHVHVMEPSAPAWQRRLLFRDYLRAHPDAVEAYVDLKRTLATTFKDDIAAYRNGKDAFVQDILTKAAQWRASQSQRS
ncbi:GrpB family protein [Bradyrhizobium ivorense]|nr:GrpB family protein [Bradyrhizobium ivorense]